ncbi:unnamed protein product [Oppiella nova]|uniref:Tetraspanin n=1 Tax=Oppiella nova TaxID=334625 RepID=A0A7R9LVH2_9ACAR|nr:unnamed protein product [Oppiella nova]CAG2167347.1 unnamed protein product [Oppiella nova]
MTLTGSIIIAYTLWALGTSANMKRLFSGTLGGWAHTSEEAFLFLCVMTIAAEIGGIISLSILKTKVSDIVEQGWDEVNQRTRNIIQEQFQCCGIAGLSEFASKLDPIDESCYRIEYIRNGTGTDAQITPIREPNRIGCKDKLVDWIFTHKMVFTVLLSVSAINHLKVRSSSMESLDEHQTITYM